MQPQTNQDLGLGDKVKEINTGLTGIVVARTECLNRGVRLTVQLRGLHGYQTVDEAQLHLITKAKASQPNKPKTGGDQPSIGQQPATVR